MKLALGMGWCGHCQLCCLLLLPLLLGSLLMPLGDPNSLMLLLRTRYHTRRSNPVRAKCPRPSDVPWGHGAQYDEWYEGVNARAYALASLSRADSQQVGARAYALAPCVFVHVRGAPCPYAFPPPTPPCSHSDSLLFPSLLLPAHPPLPPSALEAGLNCPRRRRQLPLRAAGPGMPPGGGKRK